MGVIELGVVTPYEPPESRRPHPRLLVAAVLAVVCAVTLTGSVPPRSHALTTLWGIPVSGNEDSFALTTDGVYVLTTLGQRRITAYDLRTGKIRWTLPRPDEMAWIGMVTDGVLLTPTTADSSDTSTDTVAVDTATGRELWRRPADTLAVHDGRVLLAAGDTDASSIRELREVDLHTGRQAWAFVADNRRTYVAVDDETPDRVVIAAEGQVRVLDFATGRMVAGKSVPWPGPDSRPDQPSGVGVAGHTVILPSTANGQPIMTMYDTETLRERWHLTSPTLSGLYDCGPVLCLNDGAGLTGYDGDTGRVLWQRTGDGYAATLAGDRLVIENGGDGARRVLADARTGRQLNDLGTASLGYGYDPDGPVYLLSLTSDPPGRTAVGQLDEHTGDVEVRGVLDPAADFCQSVGDLLGCVIGGVRLTITDLSAVP